MHEIYVKEVFINSSFLFLQDPVEEVKLNDHGYLYIQFKFCRKVHRVSGVHWDITYAFNYGTPLWTKIRSLNQHSLILDPRSTFLDPRSTFFDPRSTSLDPRSPFLDPPSS